MNRRLQRLPQKSKAGSTSGTWPGFGDLARVLLWAGKMEEADRLARQAQDIAGEYQQVAVNAHQPRDGLFARAAPSRGGAAVLGLEKAPDAIELRLNWVTSCGPPLRKFGRSGGKPSAGLPDLPYYDGAYAFRHHHGRAGTPADCLSQPDGGAAPQSEQFVARRSWTKSARLRGGSTRSQP